MKLVIPTCQPFSLSQSIAFIRRFPPIEGDYLVTDDSVTCALTIEQQALPFTLRERGGELEVEVPAAAPSRIQRDLARRAGDFVGASDDLGPLYTAAQGDRPFEQLVTMLYGLHHVRFLTLEEITIYAVIMQRMPITAASALKRRFLDRFGHRVVAGGHTLRAMPEFAELATLDVEQIGDAIRHRGKAARIADAIRGVARLGESFLRTAPYAEANDALLAIPGIGPFSAAAILLRGLGRMDELPWMDSFERPARQLYGGSVDPEEIFRRYGRSIGYWSFYLMTGVPRLYSNTAASCSLDTPSLSVRKSE